MFENYLPLTEFFITRIIGAADANNQVAAITIRIQTRRAKISDNPLNDPPADQNNAWRYIVDNDNFQLPGSQSEKNPADLLKTNIGPIINIERNIGLQVLWINELQNNQVHPDPHMDCMTPNPYPLLTYTDALLEMPPINPLPMDYGDAEMSKMNPSVGVIPHLHGGKLNPDSDGWPLFPMSYPKNPFKDANGQRFPTKQTFYYPNQQRAAMLWFHDHGMDNTAPQVYAGLAGLYFIRDDSDRDLITDINAYNLQQYTNASPGVLTDIEIPLVIQDRVVDCDFCCVDYWAGIPTQYVPTALPKPKTPDPQHPNPPSTTQVLNKLRPEFLGDSIFVNGRPWPHYKLTQKVYRLRLLNGSNARTYALALLNPEPWTSTEDVNNPPTLWYSDLLTVIGNEAGLFAESRTLAQHDYLLLAPGERLDVLLDLTTICPHQLPKLRLVNLAVLSVFQNQWPEPIFQSADLSVFTPPTNPPATLPAGFLDTNYLYLNSLLAIKQANIMQFCIEHIDPACHCDSDINRLNANRNQFKNTLDTRLLAYAKKPENIEGFAYDEVSKTLGAGVTIAKNRLVILMNNTGTGLANNFTGSNIGWRDTQIWEMLDKNATTASLGPNFFQFPFDIDLASDTPLAGTTAAYQEYKVVRASFLDPNGSPIASKHKKRYPALQNATIKPKKGSYERWYVANIGNWQPGAATSAGTPDMHPFHMHLVNFVVQRRFSYQPVDPNNPIDYQFIEITATQGDFYDKNVRHDTVRIQSNEMVELLVYFPEDASNPDNYTGHYPYHCHLVEHEDMGMMLHFQVQA